MTSCSERVDIQFVRSSNKSDLDLIEERVSPLLSSHTSAQ